MLSVVRGENGNESTFHCRLLTAVFLTRPGRTDGVRYGAKHLFCFFIPIVHKFSSMKIHIIYFEIFIISVLEKGYSIFLFLCE